MSENNIKTAIKNMNAYLDECHADSDTVVMTANVLRSIRDNYCELSRYKDTVENLNKLIAEKDAEIKREHETIEDYERAAKVIHLYLLDFCDENLPVDKMIAEASRRALAEIEKLQHSKSRLRKKIAKDIEKAKSEAIKEFAEKYEKAVLPLLTSATLEKKDGIYACLNILKEMEGGEADA